MVEGKKKRRCRAVEKKRVEDGGSWVVSYSIQRALATSATREEPEEQTLWPP